MDRKTKTAGRQRTFGQFAEHRKAISAPHCCAYAADAGAAPERESASCHTTSSATSELEGDDTKPAAAKPIELRTNSP